MLIDGKAPSKVTVVRLEVPIVVIALVMRGGELKIFVEVLMQASISFSHLRVVVVLTFDLHLV